MSLYPSPSAFAAAGGSATLALSSATSDMPWKDLAENGALSLVVAVALFLMAWLLKKAGTALHDTFILPVRDAHIALLKTQEVTMTRQAETLNALKEGQSMARQGIEQCQAEHARLLEQSNAETRGLKQVMKGQRRILKAVCESDSVDCEDAEDAVDDEEE